MAFLPEEQRKASFKHIYGKQQVDPDFDLDNESLEAGHQVFSADLLSAGNDIAFSPGGGGTNDPVTFTSSSVWVCSAGADQTNVWGTGQFQKTSNAGGTDSNYEKVTMPLVQFDTGHETHAAFIHVSQSSAGQEAQGTLVRYKDGRLKNWISPTKFGAGYTIKVFGSNESRTGPDTDGDQLSEAGNSFSGKNYGAMAFDYAQGVLYFAKTDSGDPDLSSYKKPLWMVGYRYIGPTGSAESSGGITSITSTTPTNLSFNPETQELSLGDDNISIGVGSAAPYRRGYYNYDFAKVDEPDFSSLVFATDYTCSSTGSDLASGNNALYLPTIHMPMAWGYCITLATSHSDADGHFTPSSAKNMNADKLSDHRNRANYTYFVHPTADGVAQIGTQYSDNLDVFYYEDSLTGNTLPIRLLTSRIDQANHHKDSADTSMDTIEFGKRWYRGPSDNPLNYNPSGQTGLQILTGLRDLINASCSDHLSASLNTTHVTGSSLQIHQVYSGNPFSGTSAYITGSDFTSSGFLDIPVDLQFTSSQAKLVHTETGRIKDRPLSSYATRSYNDQYIGNAPNGFLGSTMHRSQEWHGIVGNSANMWEWDTGRTTGTNWPYYPHPGSTANAPQYAMQLPGKYQTVQFYTIGDRFVQFSARNHQVYPIIADLTGSTFPGSVTTTLSNGKIGQRNISRESILRLWDIIARNYSYYNDNESIYKDHPVNLTELGSQYAQLNTIWDYIFSLGKPFLQITKNWSDANVAHFATESAYLPSGYQSFVNFDTYVQVMGDLDNDPSTPDEWTGQWAQSYSASSDRTAIDWMTIELNSSNYINPSIFSNTSTAPQNLNSPISYDGTWTQTAGTFNVKNLTATELSSSGPVSASGFYVNGVEFTGSGGSGDGFPFTGSAGILGSINLTGDMTASGNISASSGVIASRFYGKYLDNPGAGIIRPVSWELTTGKFVADPRMSMRFSGSEGETEDVTIHSGSYTVSGSLKITDTAFVQGQFSASSYIGPVEDALEHKDITTDNIIANNVLTSNNLDCMGRAQLGNNAADAHEVSGSFDISGSLKAHKARFGTSSVYLNWDSPGQISSSGILITGPGIIGISGSEKWDYNDGKLNDFFKGSGDSHYSLYVRNGATVVGGSVIPDKPLAHDLGSKKFPFKDLYLDKSSIIFHSGSSEESGSDKPELGRLSINTASLSAEFTSGSELIKVRAGEFNLGGGIGATGTAASIQITASSNGQGFIAVNANAQGQRSTILRGEYYELTGDNNMGSITQKGSGSFAILLDADDQKSNAKFVVESNNPIPGLGPRLFHVSESGEVRSHGYLTVSQSLEVGTHITTSGNILVGGGYLNGPTDNNFYITSDRSMVFDIDTDNDETGKSWSFRNGGITGQVKATISEDGDFQCDGHITSSGNISASGDLMFNKIDGGTF